ncbi:hypothetical protein A2Y99_01690, partial [Candidatus Gottesmanbacteria bacterium RBG_13_37_7]
MGLQSKKILGIDIIVSQHDIILEEIEKYLEKSKIQNPKSKKYGVKPLVIYTPNPEIINFAQKNDNFKQLVNSAQINIPDGQGVVWALKKKYGLKIKQISGVDMMMDLAKLCYDMGFTVGLIGGKTGVALKTRECLLEKYPDLKIEVIKSPEVVSKKEARNTNYESRSNKADNESVNLISCFPAYAGKLILNSNGKYDKNSEKYFLNLAKEIQSKRIDILFIALGCPKQEYFIDRITNYELRIKNRKPLVMMSVGGAFDYLSGRIPRAPKW